MEKMIQTMEEPVCLISTDDDGQFYVVKEAKEILDSITQPVVVVAVAGLYRTGKSYLMNRLAGKQTGFALGRTIESETKGIWMWCVPHPVLEGHTLVLLDTEGLGDVNKGDEKHDTWIFCLAVLLSSTLIYNSLGVIDNMALQNLHYITELTEHIRVKAQPDSDVDDSIEFMSIFPSFIWAVRDFTLDLVKDGQSITADEYLESALVLKHGCSPAVERYNLPRRCLRDFFAERKCFVFKRPASDDDLRRMEELTEADLNPQFLNQSQDFCSYVFDSAKPKSVTGGQVLTGTVLGSLAEVYVEAIRSGRIPCLENAVETLAQVQNVQAVKKGSEVYQCQMKQSVRFPLDPAELSDKHKQAEKKAIDAFMGISFNDNEQKAQQQLMHEIQKEYEGLCQQNEEEWRKDSQMKLKEVFTPLDEALNRSSFMQRGGYQRFQNQLQHLTNEYRARTRKQIMSEEVLAEYLEEKQKFGINILSADNSLTQAEMKNEAERWKREVLEQKNRALENQNQRQEQKIQDQESSLKQHTKQMLERSNQERERARQDNERVLEALLREQEARLKQGFMEEAARMQIEINRLKQRPTQSSNCSIC